MRKTIISTLAAGIFAAATATSALASNTRPTFIDLSGSNGENTMQNILDAVYGAGAVNAATDQQSTGLWASFTPVFPTVTPILSFEYAGNAGGNSLGFFSIDAGLTTRGLFTGSAGAGDIATIQWTGADSGLISSSNCASVVCGAFSGIGWDGFGFYINGPQTPGNVFTLDSMNDGGNPYAVAYSGPGGSATNWVIGFEDVTYANSDRDYNDMVIRVESVVAIPEPETYAMLLAGLAVMGFVARRRQRSLAA